MASLTNEKFNQDLQEIAKGIETMISEGNLKKSMIKSGENTSKLDKDIRDKARLFQSKIANLKIYINTMELEPEKYNVYIDNLTKHLKRN